MRKVAWQKRVDRQRQEGAPVQPKPLRIADSGESQEWVYPPTWVVYEMFVRHGIYVSARTVYRWMEQHDLTEAYDRTLGLSVEQLAAFEQLLIQKHRRKALMQYLMGRNGMSKDAAKKLIQRFIQHGSERRLTLDQIFQEITSAVVRTDSKADESGE